MLKRYAMVIEAGRCMNCNACVVSCQLTNGIPAYRRRNWVRKDRAAAAVFYQPGNCMQCDKPSCVAACPTKATYRDEADGIVKVNSKLCIGCGSCIPACPYGARFRHPERRVVDKCDFCLGRVSAGKEPACVETCPTRARVFGDLADPTSRVSRLVKERKTVRVVNAKVDTEPRIRYIEGAWPLDWPVEPTVPDAVRWWGSPFNPLSKGVVALSALGVMVMFGKQILSGLRGSGSKSGGGHGPVSRGDAGAGKASGGSPGGKAGGTAPVKKAGKADAGGKAVGSPTGKSSGGAEVKAGAPGGGSAKPATSASAGKPGPDASAQTTTPRASGSGVAASAREGAKDGGDRHE